MLFFFSAKKVTRHGIYFDQLYCLAQNDGKIIAFSNFCKQIHDFIKCDVEYCVKMNFIWACYKHI